MSAVFLLIKGFITNNDFIWHIHLLYIFIVRFSVLTTPKKLYLANATL